MIMSTYSREQLQQIKSFPSLVKYLHDELEWPITTNSFEDLTFDYEPEELGIDSKTAAKIEQIKQLRPLVTNQPWGIFFVKFEPKSLPVVALRRILSQLVIKKRTSAKKSEQPSWRLHDLLFISNYGEGEYRQITFAQFTIDELTGGLPVLRVLGWDDFDTALHLDHVHNTLKENLQWPDDTSDIENWRNNWSAAFTLRHREVITTSKELAESLAELAIRIRKRANKVIDIETEKGALRKLFKAFKQALVQDLSEDDFADMYAETITYGLLAARVSRPIGIVSDNLSDMIPATNPFLKDMLDTFLNVGGKKNKIDFDELGIQEVVELLNSPNTHIEAILRDFGNRTRQEDPVIHFYEFFLSAYDKKKKIERGVFYTPQPVVSFIIRSVHELLKTEFGLEDGLADITTWGEMNKHNEQIIIPQSVLPNDPFVLILDVATGTGTFLVEIIDIIYKTLHSKWVIQGKTDKQIASAWNEYVPKHLLPRLHGFELLMAPYAIAQMKIGLKLVETGYNFLSDERIHVYLTNTLEPHSEVTQLRMFSEALAKEANAVNQIKKNCCFTIVVGNPPYSGISTNKGEWISNLIENYKYIDGEHFGEKKHWLQDDYVKFLRYGENIIEKNRLGILAFINNHSFLDNPTFRGMRWHLLKTFDNILILDLHGNTKKKEVSPDGSNDKNVFDIQQGVSINQFIKAYNKKTGELSNVNHIDLWGSRESKYQTLLGKNVKSFVFTKVNYSAPFFFFQQKDETGRLEFDKGFRIDSLFEVNSVGFVSANDTMNISFLKIEQIEKIKELLKMDEHSWRIKYSRSKDARDWTYKTAKSDALRNFDVNKVQQVSYRPFDNRWTCYTGNSRGLYSSPQSKVMKQFTEGENLGLIVGRQGQVVGSMPWNLCFITKHITDFNLYYRGGGLSFPLYLYLLNDGQLTIDQTTLRTPNLNLAIVNIIANKLGLTLTIEKEKTKDTFAPIDILDYIYAVLHSPTYREKYKEFLKIDFPRVPYPDNAEIFWKLVKLGGEMRQIHLLDSRVIKKFITTYPVKGPNEVIKIQYMEGKVWINSNQFFYKVPQLVWDFYIGGYQPAQKWLKDRKGRVLSSEDIMHYQKIIVALSETDRIMKEIDKIDFIE